MMRCRVHAELACHLEVCVRQVVAAAYVDLESAGRAEWLWETCACSSDGVSQIGDQVVDHHLLGEAAG